MEIWISLCDGTVCICCDFINNYWQEEKVVLINHFFEEFF